MAWTSVVGICKFCFMSPGFIPGILTKMVSWCCLTTRVRRILGKWSPLAWGQRGSLGLRGKLAERIWGILPTIGKACIMRKWCATVWGS